jgi:hypothetical protein
MEIFVGNSRSGWMIRTGSRGRMGLNSLAGEQLVPHDFDWTISGYCLASCSRGDQLVIVDSRGAVLRRLDGVECYSSVSDGMLSVSNTSTDEDGYVSVDSSTQDIWNNFRTGRSFHRGVAAVEQYVGYRKTAWGLIDKSGGFLILPSYSGMGDFTDPCDVGPFSPMIESIREDKNWGLVNRSGEIVVPPSWSAISESFYEGLLVVQLPGQAQGGGWGLVDPTGHWSLMPVWDRLSEHVSERSIGAKANGKWGVIDLSGKWMIEPKFDFCAAFHDGVARASAKDTKGLLKTGYMDPSGKWVIEPKYDDCGDFRFGLAEVQIYNEQTGSFRSGYVDIEGNEYWEGS